MEYPLDRIPHVNELPPELLDAIFVYLRPFHRLFAAVGDKKDLCNVVLVCRLWRDIALDHLFSDVSFGIAEFTDSTYWKGKTAREPLDKRRILNQSGREVAIHCLTTVHGFLKRKPHICNTVRRLTLHRALHHFPTWDIGLVKIDLPLFQAIVELLPRLDELVLSRMVIEPSRSSPILSDLWIPRPLNRLFVDYGPFFVTRELHCETQTAHLLRCFTDLSELSIDGYYGKSLDEYRVDMPSAYPSRLRRLELRNSHISPAFLDDLRQSASMASIRHFLWENENCPPYLVQQGIQEIVNTLGPNLLSFTCTVVEPLSIILNEIGKIDPIDLTSCPNLERLSLSIYITTCDSAARVWSRVVAMLDTRNTHLWPSLCYISVKIITYQCLDVVINRHMMRPVEDALLELRRRNGTLHVDIQVLMAPPARKLDVALEVTEWFPRICTLGCISLPL